MNAADFITFADFIKQLDDDQRVNLCILCKIKPDTLYVWVHRNSIDERYWPRLMVHFPDLTLTKLYAMDAASKSNG